MVLSKSSNGGAAGNREDVIETLIDMDPCGAAYRVSKAMVRIICKSIVVCERSAHLVSIFMCFAYLMIFMLTPTQYALLLVTIPSTSNAIHHYTFYTD